MRGGGTVGIWCHNVSQRNHMTLYRSQVETVGILWRSGALSRQSSGIAFYSRAAGLLLKCCVLYQEGKVCYFISVNNDGLLPPPPPFLSECYEIVNIHNLFSIWNAGSTKAVWEMETSGTVPFCSRIEPYPLGSRTAFHTLPSPVLYPIHTLGLVTFWKDLFSFISLVLPLTWSLIGLLIKGKAVEIWQNQFVRGVGSNSVFLFFLIWPELYSLRFLC